MNKQNALSEQNATRMQNYPQRFVTEDFESQELPPLTTYSSHQILDHLKQYEALLSAGARPPKMGLLRLKTHRLRTLTSTSSKDEIEKTNEFLAVAAEVRGTFSRYVATIKFRPHGSITTCTLEHKEVIDALPFLFQSIVFWLFAFSKDQEYEAEMRKKNPDYKSGSFGTFIGFFLIAGLYESILNYLKLFSLSSTGMLVLVTIPTLVTLSVVSGIYRNKVKERQELCQAATLWVLTAFDETMGPVATGQPAPINAPARRPSPTLQEQAGRRD